jgi:hypothetical protein
LPHVTSASLVEECYSEESIPKKIFSKLFNRLSKYCGLLRPSQNFNLEVKGTSFELTILGREVTNSGREVQNSSWEVQNSSLEVQNLSPNFKS